MSMSRAVPVLARQRGFTLVEAIVVMVVTAILAGAMVLFIRRPVQNYVDAAARADMGDVAELALRRVARELHLALPNSIRVTTVGTTSLLEFIPTKAGGQYLAAEDGSSGVPLSFSDQTATSFDVIGDMPAAPYAIGINDFIVVYNLGTGFTGADAYANTAAGGNRATVTGVNGNRISFAVANATAPNPFAVGSGVASNASPGHRFNVAGQPVTFVCVNDVANGKGTLTRYWNYGFQPGQVNPATLAVKSSALMAANVSACQLTYNQTANQHTALIGFSIALARPAAGAAANNLETVTLSQQIHVDNTP